VLASVGRCPDSVAGFLADLLSLTCPLASRAALAGPSADLTAAETNGRAAQLLAFAMQEL
jgi:hypothetical protein